MPVFYHKTCYELVIKDDGKEVICEFNSKNSIAKCNDSMKCGKSVIIMAYDRITFQK